MVFVDHNAVVAQFVDVLAFVEVALKEAVGGLGVKEAVGEGQAEGGVLVAFGVGVFVVGEFAEVVDFHRLVLFLNCGRSRQVGAGKRLNIADGIRFVAGGVV